MESLEQDIAFAIDFGAGDVDVYVSKVTGEVIRDDETYSGIPCPVENIDQDPDYIRVPTKGQLGLGVDLVFQFGRERFPEDESFIERTFRKRGAFGRFKVFLEGKDALEAWYAFSEERTLATIAEWCDREGIRRTG